MALAIIQVAHFVLIMCYYIIITEQMRFAIAFGKIMTIVKMTVGDLRVFLNLFVLKHLLR